VGSSANFNHFKVTVSRIAQNGSQVRLLVKVCVKSLPPNPQGNRTRISWDPWSIRAGSHTIKPKSPSQHLGDEFPHDATYKIGQCAKGWIPFVTNRGVTRIKYANGVGDTAVWDAAHLSAKPKTTTTERKPAPPKPPEVNRSAKDYPNCNALNADYPHGVGRPGRETRPEAGANR
jgi:hypothetical protein